MSFLNSLLHCLAVGGMKDKLDNQGLSIVYRYNTYLTEAEIDKIIGIKSQHWDYSYDLQRSWMADNLNENDAHLWIENANHEIIAYMNHVLVECVINDTAENMIGVGNVCVSQLYTGKGLGKLLMQVSDFYISKHASNAILLCKDEIKPFYQKSDWKLFEGKVEINSMVFDKNLFSLHKIDAVELFLNRNF